MNEGPLRPEDVARAKERARQLDLTEQEIQDVEIEVFGRPLAPVPPPPATTDDPVETGLGLGMIVGALFGLGYGFAKEGFWAALGSGTLFGLAGMAVGAGVGWLVKNGK